MSQLPRCLHMIPKYMKQWLLQRNANDARDVYETHQEILSLLSLGIHRDQQDMREIYKYLNNVKLTLFFSKPDSSQTSQRPEPEIV